MTKVSIGSKVSTRVRQTQQVHSCTISTPSDDLVGSASQGCVKLWPKSSQKSRKVPSLIAFSVRPGFPSPAVRAAGPHDRGRPRTDE
jgi:hypothetical protein